MKINRKFLIFLILAGILFRFGTLCIEGLWYDEARQFMAAKGTIYSVWPESNHKLVNVNIVRLCSITIKSFLGSPFFTVLLHYWSKISNAEVWLRLLPLLFGIGVLPIMYRLALACNFSRTFALFVTAFCSWVGPWIFYSLELRPYSLEIFFTALSLLLLVDIFKHKRVLVVNYLWLSLSMLVGIVSGYGYIIICVLIAASAVFFIAITADAWRRKLIKTLLVIIPVLVSYLYVNCIFSARSMVNNGELKSVNIALSVSAEYLSYLHGSFHSSFWVYILGIINLVLSMISWQLFYVGRFNLGFFNNLPLGLPFFFLVGIIFLCIALLISFLFKRKRYEEGVVLVIFLGAVVVCIILSTLQLFPIGPIRQNLFLSPALLMSFFIFLKYLYRAANRIGVRINWNYCILLIFILMIIFNIMRVNKSLIYGRNGEEIRPLLRKIESSYHKGDKVCVYLNKRSLPSFIYEWQYAPLPWMDGLKRKNIYGGVSFKARVGSGYDYQWYLFILDHELANSVKNDLIKKGVLIEEEYTFFPKVDIFRARIDKGIG